MIDSQTCPVSYRDLVDQDPYPFFENVRRTARVHWDTSMQGWLLTRYDDCAFVETREDLFALIYNGFPGVEETQGKHGILLLQGESHRVLHTRLIQYFTRKTREYRATYIRPLVERQIDRFAASGQVELASAFATDIPIRVICAILGLPWHDEAFFERSKRWTDEIVRWNETYGAVAPVREAAIRAAGELADLLMPIILDRRQHPRDDLISELWAMGPAVLPDWSASDVLDQCKILFVAGSETTARLICTMMYLLAVHPELRERIDADRDHLVPGFVEETLRMFAPSQHRIRRATQDLEIGGVPIRAGDLVYPLAAAAGRDPERYPDPQTIDPTRPGVTRHLAFNVGPRLCVGAPLARAEAVEAITALLGRLPRPRLAPDAAPPRFAGFVFRSFQPLHIQFDPLPVA